MGNHRRSGGKSGSTGEILREEWRERKRRAKWEGKGIFNGAGERETFTDTVVKFYNVTTNDRRGIKMGRFPLNNFRYKKKSLGKLVSRAL